MLGAPGGQWTLGIGDDAAVLAPRARRAAPSGRRRRAGRSLLFATDLLLEEQHFSRRWSSPSDIAAKALAANASDIAAMGGTPLGAVLGLGAPPDLETAWIRAFARGLSGAGCALGLPVVGGDTVRAPLLVIAIAVLGEAPAGGAVRRGGAKPGDVLCVTGDLGASAAGLELLRTSRARERIGPGSRAALVRHRRGLARLREGAILAEAGAHAMIDVSDGLASDAWHIARASGVRLVIDAARLPIRAGTRAIARRVGRDALSLALGGGEDYELLVALSSRAAERATRALKRAGAAPLTVIGRVERGAPGVALAGGDGEQGIPPIGFDHFRQVEIGAGGKRRHGGTGSV